MLSLLPLAIVHLVSTIKANPYVKAFENAEFKNAEGEVVSGVDIYKKFQQRGSVNAKLKHGGMVTIKDSNFCNDDRFLALDIDGEAYYHQFKTADEQGDEEENNNNIEGEVAEFMAPLLLKQPKSPTLLDAVIMLNICGFAKNVDYSENNQFSDVSMFWQDNMSNEFHAIEHGRNTIKVGILGVQHEEDDLGRKYEFKVERVL